MKRYQNVTEPGHCSEKFKERTTAEWLPLLEADDLCACPGPFQVLADPQAEVNVTSPDGAGRHWRGQDRRVTDIDVRTPVTPQFRHRAGQHTEELLLDPP
jgi:hypothetical protein